MPICFDVGFLFIAGASSVIAFITIYELFSAGMDIFIVIASKELAQQRLDNEPSDLVKKLLESLGQQHLWRYQSTGPGCLNGPWFAATGLYAQPSIYEDGTVNIHTSAITFSSLDLTVAEQKLIDEKAAPIFAKFRAEIQLQIRTDFSRYLDEVAKMA